MHASYIEDLALMDMLLHAGAEVSCVCLCVFIVLCILYKCIYNVCICMNVLYMYSV